MKWNEIEQSEKWASMTPQQRRLARERYFDEFVAPQAPEEFDPADLRARWMAYSDRDEAANAPGAVGPRSRGGARNPMTAEGALVSQAQNAVGRGVPIAEVKNRIGELESFAKGDRPFDDMNARARSPRGGNPMGYVSTQDEIDEATLTPEQLLAKRQAEYESRVGFGERIRNRVDQGFAQAETGIASLPMSAAVDRLRELETTGDVVMSWRNDMPQYASEIFKGKDWEDFKQRTKDEAQKATGEFAASTAMRNRYTASIPKSPASEFASREGAGWSDLGTALATDPLGLTADMAVPSAVAMAPALAASAVTRNPVLGATMMGATGFTNERAGSMVEYLAEQGVDTTSEEAIRKALSDPAIYDAADKYATTRAAIIAPIDAAGMGLASKTLAPGIRGFLKREAVSTLVGQPIAQGAIGAAGEIAATKATGREIKPFDVAAEVVGEMAMSPAETAPYVAERVINRGSDVIGNMDNDALRNVANSNTATRAERMAAMMELGARGDTADIRPQTPAAKGATDAAKIIADAQAKAPIAEPVTAVVDGPGLVVPPVDGVPDDAELDSLLSGLEPRNEEGADRDVGAGALGGGDQLGEGGVPEPANRTVGRGGVADGTSTRGLGDVGSGQPSPELTYAENFTRDALNFPQQPQAEVTLEPDSLRQRKANNIARADFNAYLQERGVDMAESDRRSSDQGDRIPQPEGEPVAIGPSRLAGKGVIATAPIRRPVTLFDSSAEGPVRTDAGRYVNHSPEPNADVQIVQGRIVAIPKREIGSGQELTINYREIDPLRDELASQSRAPEVRTSETQTRTSEIQAAPPVPFDPDARAAADFERRIAALGQDFTPAQIERLRETMRSTLPRDRVTGLHRSEELDSTLDAMHASGQPAVYVESDLGNLGGLNEQLGNSGANPYIKLMTDTIMSELEPLGATVGIRKGGDEFGFVVQGAEPEAVHAAMTRARTRYATAIAEAGLSAIKHPKGGKPGVNMHFAVDALLPGKPIGETVSTADKLVERRKKGESYEFRDTSQQAGPVESPRRRVGDRDQSEDRGAEQAAAVNQQDSRNGGVEAGTAEAVGSGVSREQAQSPAVQASERVSDAGSNGAVRVSQRVDRGTADNTGSSGRDGGSDSGGERRAPESQRDVQFRETLTAIADRARKQHKGVTIEVVQSPEDLPAEAKRGDGYRTAEAWTDRKGRVILVADKIADHKRAREVLAHEIIGHIGVEKVIGEAWNDFVNAVSDIHDGKQKASKAIREAISEAASRYPKSDPKNLARESFAIMAERGVTGSLLDRIIAEARKFWRSTFGLATISDAELLTILADAAKAVAEPNAETQGNEGDEQESFSQPRTPAQAAAENAQKRTAVGAATGAQQPITFGYSDKFTDDIRGNLRKLRELAQDKMLSALFVQEDIEAARGAISDAVNVYRRENLMHGRTGDQLEQLKRTHVDPLVKAIKAEGLDDAVVEDYLEAKFAPERNAIIAAKNPSMPDGGSGMTNAEAADFLAGNADGHRSGRKITRADVAKLNRIAAKIQTLRNETLDRLESSGMISAASKAAMQAQAPNYVPLRGKDGVEITGGRGGAGKGIDVRGKPIKEALGRGAGNRAVNILAEMIADAERSIVQAEKNRVGKTLARLVLENKNPDLWEVEPVRTEQKLDATGQVYQAVMPNAQDQEAIRFVHKGEQYFVRIADKRLREAMKNLGVDNTGVMIKLFGGINRYFSAVLTRYNPSFVIVNMLRDLNFGMTGVMAEHGAKVAGKAAANYPAAMRAMWRDNRGTLTNSVMDRYAREFAESGGKTFFAKRDSVEEIAGRVSAEFKSYGQLLRRGQIGLALSKRINSSATLEIINAANDSVENAMRLAVYSALRESGKSIEQAAEYSKNVTVNFNRKGQAATLANAVILFYNAATQGAHRSIKLLRNPKVMAAMGALAGAQAVLAAMAMGADDRDEDGLTAWEKIPSYEKERNLIIPVVGVDSSGRRQIRMVKIPMPYGFNVFSYAGGRMIELVMSKEPKPAQFANDMGNAVVNAFSPVKFIDGMDGIKPHFMKILDALGKNKDDLGIPIRSENQYSPYDQPRASMGKADTPEIYQFSAKALNRLGGGDEVTPPKIMQGLLDWAPEDLEYLVEQLTGGTGRFVSQTYGAGEKLLAGVDVHPSDYPILRSLVGEVSQTRATAGVFYDRRDQIERELARLRLKAKSGDISGARKLISETPELSGVKLHRFKTGLYLDKSGDPELEAIKGSQFEAYKKAKSEVTRLNDEIKDAQRTEYTTLKEKIDAIRAKQEEREIAQRRFNEEFAKRAKLR